MARGQETQRQRTQANPLELGKFGRLTIKYLRGTLGPLNQVVGRADTNSQSNGGFGGGTYNHWFKITLLQDAWIIIAKGGPRPKYIQTSVYDLNKTPIEGRGIFQGDTVSLENEGRIYYPYVGQVMGAQSDLYNNFDSRRLDKGDERYYPLTPGSYLLCISTTRNELLSYAVAVVIETADLQPFLLLEDGNFVLFEDPEESFIITDVTADYDGSEIHNHSLSEWQAAWRRENKDDEPFPALLIPYTTEQ